MAYLTYNNQILTFNGARFQYNWIWDTDASILINRMIAVGETPTFLRQVAINDCITSLKANSLFDTQFDVLVVTKGHGPTSTKMNWIKNSFNATGSATYTQDVGYNSNGSSTYLNSNYIPSVDGSLWSIYDCNFLIKIANAATGTGHRIGATQSSNVTFFISGQDAAGINSLGYDAGRYSTGYNCLSRASSSQLSLHINSGTQLYTSSVDHNLSITLFIFAMNTAGTPSFYTAITEIIELYAMGKSITQAQFNIFQTIMNTYFATF
jgi:hypothetical protein